MTWLDNSSITVTWSLQYPMESPNIRLVMEYLERLEIEYEPDYIDGQFLLIRGLTSERESRLVHDWVVHIFNEVLL